MKMARVLLGMLAVMLCACGDDDAPEVPTVATRQATEPVVGEASPAPDPAPSGPVVDLFRAVATDVAVSSAYRDRVSQVEQLADGDLETAWNSRTDDLVGAWIDVRIPEDASVTGIEMTVGYTKVTNERDLFVGNHRVSRVRVFRDGDEVATHALDVASRGLQSIPVEGPGGVYRIEVLEVTAGEREDWRETCISELRVMGRTAEAADGRRYPRFAVGALPEVRPEPADADRDAVKRLFHRRVAWFADHWIRYEQGVHDFRIDVEVTGEGDPEERRALERDRREALEKVLEVVEPVDPARSDALRVEMTRDEGGLKVASAALTAVADWLEDDHESCWWSKTLVRIRLANVLRRVSREAELWEASEMMEGIGPADRQRLDRLYEAAESLDEINASWNSNGRGMSTRLSRITLPEVAAETQSEWDELGHALTTARATCGWDR